MRVFCIYFLLYFLFVSLFSCKKPGCFGNAGATIKEQRLATTFNQIDISDNINLIITQGATEAIQVEAGKNIVPHILTNIENNILTIKNTASCSWIRNPSEKVTIYITIKNLTKVNYNGSGNITSTNTIHTENIDFTSREGAGNVEVTLEAKQTFAYIHNENADFIFHGHSDVCYAYANARGTFHFNNFFIKKMVIEYSSVQDCYINVSEDINATLFHTGNLYYRGTPSIVTTKSHSSGRLLPAP